MQAHELRHAWTGIVIFAVLLPTIGGCAGPRISGDPAPPLTPAGGLIARCSANAALWAPANPTASPLTEPLYLDAAASDASPGSRPAEPALSLSVAGTFLYGSVRGDVQTPSGGEPGSTDHQRPRLSEIGIDNASIYDAGLSLSWGPHSIYGGAQFIGLSGSATLDENLVSHGVSFPAGTHVSSDVRLDWYRVGYRYQWDLSCPQSADQWTLSPSLGGVFFDFDYKLHGEGGQRADRSYIKANVQGGLELEYRPGRGPLSFSIGAVASPPFSSLVLIAMEQASVRYRFVDTPKVQASAVLGVAFEQIDFKDDQQVSNHVHADMGPLLLAGLELKF